MLRYFGPPGCGKTTTLLNQVDKHLAEGVSANQIGYFAYTRKAANEARDRAVLRFHLDPQKDLMFFRTLHSLAFRLLGFSVSDVMKEAHLKEFSKHIGVNLVESNEFIDEEGFSAYRSNHPVMRLIDLSRTTLLGPRTIYNQSQLQEPRHLFLHIFSEYERFKQQHRLVDYTDMLVNLAAKPQVVPKFKVCLLDEAQDLTPLQWEIVKNLDQKAERLFLAGDDDQGIFRWAGADVTRFISLPGGSETLKQSYRIPQKIWTVADTVSKRIKRRQKKDWFPRPELGEVHHIYDTYGMNFPAEQEWLILSQAHYQVTALAQQLKTDGVFFERFGEASLGKKIRQAILSWQYLQQEDNEISLSEAVNLYQHISTGPEKIRKGAKTLLKSADEKEQFTLGFLQQHYGLRATGPWETALDRIKEDKRAYAATLLANGVDLRQAPKIKISTIHGAKGGESDNVLIFLDLSTKALEEMERTPDDAYRVLYVGVTRARHKLVIKRPENIHRGWAL